MSSIAERLMGFVDEVKHAGLVIEAYSEPFFASEILDSRKRREFINDYKRLLPRCGYAAMDAIFDLYMLEQKAEGKKPFPKGKFFVYNNTARILARFAKAGWIDIYLTKRPVSQIVMQTGEQEVEFRGAIVGGLASEVRIKPSRLSNGPVQKIYKGAEFIPANQVRRVFARIDRKYSSKGL